MPRKRLADQQEYYITQRAHDRLAELFITKSAATYSRRKNNAIYDGLHVHITSTIDNHEGLSHALNFFAGYYTMEEFIDNRQPYQINQCEKEMNKGLIFRTRKEALLYNETYGPPTYTALWSNEQLMEYSNIEDPDTGELKLTYTRKKIWLQLKDGPQQFYTRMAQIHKMTPPHPHDYISAAIEAIGCEWIVLPDDFRDVLKANPNYNKARKPTPTRNRKPKGVTKKYGNFLGTPFTPNMDLIKPWTPQRLAEIRHNSILNHDKEPLPPYFRFTPEDLVNPEYQHLSHLFEQYTDNETNTEE